MCQTHMPNRCAKVSRLLRDTPHIHHTFGCFEIFSPPLSPHPPSPQGGKDLRSAGIPKHTRFKWFSPHVLVLRDFLLPPPLLSPPGGGGRSQIRLKSRNIRISSGCRVILFRVMLTFTSAAQCCPHVAHVSNMRVSACACV